MRKCLLFTILLSSMLLAACTQTVVQYQCQNGSFVDAPEKCQLLEWSTEQECPELNCAACPAKIEYQEKIVEKPVVETKIETKTIRTTIYVCPDGIKEVSDKQDCGYTLGDSITAGSFRWKFTKLSTAERIGSTSEFFGFMGAEADGIFLIVDAQVENVGKSAEYLRSSDIKLVDTAGREYSTDTSAAYYLEPDGSELSFDTLNPGIFKNGKIVFDVPRDLKIADIRIASSSCDTNDLMYNVRVLG